MYTRLSKGIIKLVSIKYLLLWLMATYISIRLYYKQFIDLDFRFWENDLTTVATIGYVYLTYKLYTQLIK